MSGDADQEYVSDGNAENPITALSRIRLFFVIAGNTIFTSKGRSVDVQDVARELGVRCFVEGSVRKAGGRVRITAQLVDGNSGNHLWAQRYDRDLEDIFAVQDGITRTVVGAIGPGLDRAEQARALQRPPDNLDAWDLLHRGLWYLPRFDKSDLARADELFRRAVELAPEFGRAYAALATAKFVAFAAHFSDAPADEIEQGFVAARKAVSIDDRDDFALRALGIILFAKGEDAHAIDELRRSLDIDPSSSMAHHWLGWVYAFDRRWNGAIRQQDVATRLSPNHPVTWRFMNVRAYACFNAKRFEETAAWARKATLQRNAGPGCHTARSSRASGISIDRKRWNRRSRDC